VLAAACWFLGAGRVRHHLFAALFLFFIVPPPTAWVHAFSQWLQLWSADAAELLFRITGTTLFRSGQTLMLAGIRPMEVAEECSGVRSTLVLLITALLAGKLLFRSNWSRAALFFAVIPLGILRNGFRIVTIGLLCVHIDQSMIDSWIHRRGGPVFFALSLVPLLLLAKLLQVLERRRGFVRSTQPPPGPGVRSPEFGDGR
jgi:exosortase